MKLRQLAQLVQALHHCNLVSTQVPAEPGNTRSFSATLALRGSSRPETASNRHSQFGELLQIGQLVHVSDVVVLQEQMGEVGGEVEVANVRDLIVVQVENGEVSALGEVVLENKSLKVRN